MSLLPSFIVSPPTSSPPPSPLSGLYRHEDESQERQESMQLAPPPPLCLTGVMCQESSLSVKRILSDGTPTSFTIRYLVFRPRQFQESIMSGGANNNNNNKPPLVVLHGGPGVPSNYLLPLVNRITDRSIVFYDQLGCGRSSRPTDKEACYSIESFVHDLQHLLRHWNLAQFHLYGHSFGGILAFEYLKKSIIQKKKKRHATDNHDEQQRGRNDDDDDENGKQHAEEGDQKTERNDVSGGHDDEQVGPSDEDNNNDDEHQVLERDDESIKKESSIDDDDNYNHHNKCLSLILSSVPTSIPLVEKESRKLLRQIIRSEHQEEEDELDEESKRRVLELFRQQHECRVLPTPMPLLNAYEQAGTIWRGTEAIPDYVATFLEDDESSNNNNNNKLPPALILRGQFDFVTQLCTEGWNDIFKDAGSQSMVLAGCSHHGLLENEELYGDVIESFLVDNDPTS